jgi:hypothetical protein
METMSKQQTQHTKKPTQNKQQQQKNSTDRQNTHAYITHSKMVAPYLYTYKTEVKPKAAFEQKTNCAVQALTALPGGLYVLAERGRLSFCV